MRIFGPTADRIGRWMERMEVEPIEHKWVANSIEGAQKKVEGMNFDTRKHVVEYDDVMNTKREIIYSEREKVLTGADTRDNITDYMRGLIERGVEGHCQGRHPEMWDLDGLLEYLGHYFPIPPGTEVPEEALRRGRQGLGDYLQEAAVKAYEAKEEQLGADEVRRQVERFVLLRTIDVKWIEYLTTMEHFREGVGLEAYAQRDPLIEYKNQAFTMFNDLKESIQADVVANMFRVQLMPQEEPPKPTAQLDRAVGDGSPGARAAGPGGKPGPNGKIGRNDPCWCGSGRKFKRCHGR